MTGQCVSLNWDQFYFRIDPRTISVRSSACRVPFHSSKIAGPEAGSGKIHVLSSNEIITCLEAASPGHRIPKGLGLLKTELACWSSSLAFKNAYRSEFLRRWTTVVGCVGLPNLWLTDAIFRWEQICVIRISRSPGEWTDDDADRPEMVMQTTTELLWVNEFLMWPASIKGLAIRSVSEWWWFPCIAGSMAVDARYDN